MVAKPDDLPLLVTGAPGSAPLAPPESAGSPTAAVQHVHARFPGHLEQVEPLLESAAERIPPDVIALPRPHFIEWHGETLKVGLDAPGGEPLDRLLLASPRGLDRRDAMAIIASLATALAALHRLELVHADLRPRTIFVDRATMQPRLAHWGYLLPTHVAPGDGIAVSVAADGVPYASPEVLEGATPGTEDDVFALGCISYELLTGKHPFARRPATDARAAHERARPVADLTPRQQALLDRALGMDRAERRIALGDVALAFGEPARPEAGGGAAPSETELAIPQRAPRRLRWLRAGLALGLIAAGIVTFVWRQSTDTAARRAVVIPQAGPASTVR